MNTPHTASSRRLAAPVLACLAPFALLLANPVRAQTEAGSPPPSSADDSVLKLDKFVVTGSYLPPAANAVAVPVITVDSKAIENAGDNSNVLEILRKTVPQFTGNANLGSANANVGSGSTNGGSVLALRNTVTLVLINGRRAAFSPVSASGGGQFVDVNLIPVPAIERIEVLADGASAIYGTDAVAGVVNIILKTDFQGFELGARYGWSPNTGHYEDKSGYLVGGTSNGKTSITLSAEWNSFTPIYNFQRPYSAVTFGTPTFAGSVNIGGNYYYLDPSLSTPAVAPGGSSAAALVSAGTYSGPRSAGDQFTLFNLSQYVTQTLASQRQAFTMSFDHEVNDGLKAFGDFIFANTQTQSQINGQPINSSAIFASGVPAGQYGNPFDTAVVARNRLTDHPRQTQNDTTSARGVLGFLGKIGTSGWTWESAVDYNRVLENFSNPGVISQAHLTAAVLDGDFNFFSRTPISSATQLQDQIVGTATGEFISTLKNFDFKVRGKLFDLPGGPVDMALGAEIRREALSATADPNSVIDPVTGTLGWSGAVTLTPFSSSRVVKSEFAEIRVPLAKDLSGAHLPEVSGAVRHEAYSDTTNPTVPKFTLRYLPFNDEFAFRASYSKSFSAPTLFNLFGPGGIGFTTPFALTAVGGGVINNFQTNSQAGSNPNLKPSNARNYSFGIVYSPKAIKGFSLSLDYWNIRQTDLISTIGAPNILESVELLGPSSPYINAVGFGGFKGAHPTAPGQISTGVPDDIFVTDTLVNIAGQKLDGIDGALRYTWNVESVGRFDVTSNLGYYRHYLVKTLPDLPEEEDAGSSSFTNGTIPRWISSSSVEFNRGKYDAFVAWRHLPGVHDIEDDTHTGSFDSFDVSASYSFGSSSGILSGAKVMVGCNNVFNKFGPADPTVFTDSNVDTSTYGAIGRFVYVDVKYKF